MNPICNCIRIWIAHGILVRMCSSRHLFILVTHTAAAQRPHELKINSWLRKNRLFIYTSFFLVHTVCFYSFAARPTWRIRDDLADLDHDRRPLCGQWKMIDWCRLIWNEAGKLWFLFKPKSQRQQLLNKGKRRDRQADCEKACER